MSHVSKRGIPLVWSSTNDKPFMPVVTMESYLKWYNIYIVHPSGVVEYVEFPDEPDAEGSPYVDHTPNPRHVIRWAERMGYAIDGLALELIVGRWHLEARSEYERE